MSKSEEEKYWEEMDKAMEKVMSMSDEEFDKFIEEDKPQKHSDEWYEQHKNGPFSLKMA